MSSTSNQREGTFQLIGSTIGLLLPAVQVFIDRLPAEAKEIFLFRDYLLIVSVVTAIITYIAIIGIKNIPGFEIPIKKKKHARLMQYIHRTNPQIFNNEEVNKYQKENIQPPRPFYISPNTLPLAAIPLLVLSFAVFIVIGLIGKDNNIILLVTQAFSYFIFVAVAAIALAIHYITQRNFAKYEIKRKTFYKDLIALAYDERVFEEAPEVRFVTQSTPSPYQIQTIVKLGNMYYAITSNPEATQIFAVAKYKDRGDLLLGIEAD